MRLSQVFAAAALGCAVFAAPTKVTRDSATLASWSFLGSWACGLDSVEQPTAPTPLPSPTGQLVQVAIGRGTQNYTCDLTNKTAVPTSIGAVATLYDASCVATYASSLLQYLPKIVLELATPSENPVTILSTSFAQSLVLGTHFFTNSTSPHFDLNTANGQLGQVLAVKNTVSNAPPNSPKGRYGHGNGSVQWLYLTVDPQASMAWQGFSEVYRLQTAGGNPPSTCRGMPAEFEVQYSAEYWFYQ